MPLLDVTFFGVGFLVGFVLLRDALAFPARFVVWAVCARCVSFDFRPLLRVVAVCPAPDSDFFKARGFFCAEFFTALGPATVFRSMGFLVGAFLTARFVFLPGIPALEIAMGHFSFT